MEQAEGMQHQNTAPTGISPIAQDVPEEKVLKQSEVNELVGRIKHEAFEKGKREALAQISPPSAPPAQGMGGMPPITDDHIRNLISEEAQKQAQLNEVKKTLDNFVQQMEAGKGKYSDFDETVAKLGNLQNIPHIVQMAADSGMSGDVMYELGKNPNKVASLTTLAYINPDLAKQEMKKLVDSLKMNEQASESPNVKPPLSQVTPSTVGTDNGSHSVRDFRKKYRA